MSLNFFNFEILLIILAVIVLIIFLYIYSDKIFSIFNKPSKNKIGLYKRLKISLQNKKLALIGALATTKQLSNAVNTTVVNLTDEELNQLLDAFLSEIGTSNIISVTLLQSWGLYTPTVMSYLEALGYIIL